eukprot:GHRQ01010699.1.p1 GENE.GHRQ01010699.1~~GHRQ01010699.1.p1  ORF type:complete len:215 (+),score=45.38 GHRQ01010699.1:767-1411(+)
MTSCTTFAASCCCGAAPRLPVRKSTSSCTCSRASSSAHGSKGKYASMQERHQQCVPSATDLRHALARGHMTQALHAEATAVPAALGCCLACTACAAQLPDMSTTSRSPLRTMHAAADAVWTSHAQHTHPHSPAALPPPTCIMSALLCASCSPLTSATYASSCGSARCGCSGRPAHSTALTTKSPPGSARPFTASTAPASSTHKAVDSSTCGSVS